MSRTRPKPWTGRRRSLTALVARACLVFLLVLQIVYTPLHLFLEPHWDEADFSGAGDDIVVTTMAAEDDHDDPGGQARHSAAEHKLKVLRSQRAAPMDLIWAIVPEAVISEQECPRPQDFDSCGLSPPECSNSWHFRLRAALPVRAPSLLA